MRLQLHSQNFKLQLQTTHFNFAKGPRPCAFCRTRVNLCSHQCLEMPFKHAKTLFMIGYWPVAVCVFRLITDVIATGAPCLYLSAWPKNDVAFTESNELWRAKPFSNSIPAFHKTSYNSIKKRNHRQDFNLCTVDQRSWSLLSYPLGYDHEIAAESQILTWLWLWGEE